MIYLSHGASGTAESMSPFVRGLHRRGLDAQAVGLPVRKAEEVVDLYRAQVADLDRAIIGGQSYGGRVASLLAAQERPRALVLLCYPLHRPGQPNELRTSHWARIDCPVLLLSGEADPFARIDMLRDSVRLLSDHRLISYPGVRHGLKPVLDDALDRIAEFVGAL